MKRVNKKFYILAAVALCGFAGTAMATPVGFLGVANCNGGGVQVNATTVTWLPATLGGTAGCIAAGISTTVTYAGGTLAPGTLGNIKNLTAGGGAVDIFMSFTGTPLDFVLNGLGPGSGNFTCTGLSVGSSCSVGAGSPFILTNAGSGNTTITLGAFGTVTDGVGPGTGTSNWGGSFSTQINQTPDVIQTEIFGGATVTSTHSGQFQLSSVPEPATMSMMGIGLLGLGLIARRRKS